MQHEKVIVMVMDHNTIESDKIIKKIEIDLLEMVK
jgi:hypothetical protein